MTPTLKTTITMHMCELLGKVEGVPERGPVISEAVDELLEVLKHREDALNKRVETLESTLKVEAGLADERGKRIEELEGEIKTWESCNDY